MSNSKDSMIVQLTITKTAKGYSVYKKNKEDEGFDVFPKTDSGHKRLIEFLCDQLINKEE